MNWKIKQTLLTVLLYLTCEMVSGQFSGGIGASWDPYQITTPEQLNMVRNYLNESLVFFILMNDLDLTDECSVGGIFYNSGQGWIPIGSSSTSSFRGDFDGNDKKIIGLYINRPANNQGLFGYLQSAGIKNLKLTNTNITGSNSCGIIAGMQASGYIINCEASGSVSGTLYIGGIAGEQQSNIKKCHTSGTITGSQYVGGISGYLSSDDASITNSSSECTVTGSGSSSIRIGGIAGSCYGSLTNCTASGNVSGASEIGGLAGISSNYTTINACYSTGTVQGSNENVGGFAGKLSPRTNVSHCYSLSNVIRTNGTNTTFGAFCGLNEDAAIKHCYSTGSVTISDGSPLAGKGFTGDITTGDYLVMTGNYYDMNTSGLTSGLGATGKTTEEMMIPATFEGWDFEHVWDIDYNDSYPFLLHDGIYPAPRKLSASSDSSCVHLNWISPNGEVYNGYRIFRDSVRIGPEVRIESWFNDSTAINGMTYTYHVVALYGQELSIPSNTVVVTRFAGGTGSTYNPYLISTPAQLSCMRNYLNNNSISFILLNDIDLTAACSAGGEFYNFGQGWIPMGSASDKAFKGRLDGNNKKITGLFMNRNMNNQGLFGYIVSGQIQNLGVENASITGSSHCGGLVGYLSNSSSISNSFFNGSVSGSTWIGGLAGYCESTIKNSYSKGSVSGFNYTGGLIGFQYNSSIKSCYSESNVTGSYSTGGLVGSGGNVTNSYSSGSVTGYSETGGLIGDASGTINACYSLGPVQSNGSNTGGLIGKLSATSYVNNSYSRGNVTRSGGTSTTHGAFCGLNDNGIINHCYSTGSVKTLAGVNIEGKGFVGGFTTGDYLSMKGNYFDMNSSGQAVGVGAEGRTTSSMYLEDTFEDWDFEHVWNIDEYFNYPELKQEGIYSPPRNLTASANDYRVYLDWLAPLGEYPDGYRIFRDGQLLTLNMLTVSSYIDSSVFHGMNYTYHVIAYFNSSPSIPSNTVQVTLFSEGGGYYGNPYLITNHHQLNCVRNYLDQNDVYFKLMNDIDLTAECSPGGDYYYFGQGWIPIGNSTAVFMGQFDGNGKKITGLFINRNTPYQGFFGYAESAQITNLGLENVNVTGSTNCGGLVGYVSTGSLINYCFLHGNVQGGFWAGGLVGQSRSSIKNSHTTGSVTGTGYTGGVVGWFWPSSGIMSGCYSSTVVNGSSSTGGLIGSCSSPVMKCYSTGNVTGSSETGGLIGTSSGPLIQNSYSIGNVGLSGSNGGGFIGKIASNTQVKNCYSRGNLTRTGGTNVAMGGFCGLNDNSKILNCYSTGSVKTSTGTNIEGKGFTGSFVTGANMVMTDNYFDMNTSGQTTANGASGKTTDAMTYPYEYGTFTGWDFADTWRADYAYLNNNGYPLFYWQQPNGLQVPLVTTTEATTVTAISAISGGNVTFDGNTTVTSRGVCWSTAPNPTIQNFRTDEGPGVEEFTSTLSGLNPSMTYYIRAYATNTVGTGYGNNLSFTTTPAIDPSLNLIRCGPTTTTPEALPVQITGSSANPYTSNLSQWTGTYQAPQSLYDQGTYKNDPARWSNISGSSSTGSKWYNTSPGTSFGILVVDLKQIRALQNICVFQMFGDGKCTHIALASHPETSSVSPSATDPGWSIILPKSSVGSGTNNSSYISSPTTFTVNATTRYIKIMVYNDGSLGNQSYISLKGIKIYGGPYAPNSTINHVLLNDSTSDLCFGATQTITVSDFIVDSGGSATFAAGMKVLFQSGTKAVTGGHLHAFIKTDGNYCQTPSMVSSPVILSEHESWSTVAHQTKSTKIIISPNPNHGQFKVVFQNLHQNPPFILKIFSQLGERIGQDHIINENQADIDIADHPSGVYFLLVQAESYTSVHKVIVQKR